MSKINQAQLARILADENLGAGNFLHYLLNENPYKHQDYLFLERPIAGFGNKSITSFSLQTLSECAREWAA